MATCSFCGCTLSKGSGTMYVKKDGRILYFCSLKCEKNMIQLNRKPRQTAWTFTAHQVKKAEKQ